jgi:hypothetical protein
MNRWWKALGLACVCVGSAAAQEEPWPTLDEPPTAGPPADCSESNLYGIHDEEAADTQFFRIDLLTGESMDLGPLYVGANIEAMDLDPLTGRLYGIGRQLVEVDRNTGELFVIADMGFTPVGSAFDPSGRLWVSRDRRGLYTIDLTTGESTLMWPFPEGVTGEWEGIAWDPRGRYLWAVDGDELLRWDPLTQEVLDACGDATLPTPSIEALDFDGEGTLIAGWHHGRADELAIIEINQTTCDYAAWSYPSPYYDVESLAFEMCVPAGHALSGTIFDDEDGDGVWDPAERGAFGVTVRVIDTTTLAVLAEVVTAYDGGFAAGGLPDSEYRVQVVPVVGATATLDPDGGTSTEVEVVVAGADVGGLTFGLVGGCQNFEVYGIQDAGSGDTQLFGLDPFTGLSWSLGEELEDVDLKSLAVHPATGELYGAAGPGGERSGDAFVIDTETGDARYVGNSHLFDHAKFAGFTLDSDGAAWILREDFGLFKVTFGAAPSRKLMWRNTWGSPLEFGGVTWNADESFLYFTTGRHVMRWSEVSGVEEVCGWFFLPDDVTGLTLSPEGTLLAAWDDAPTDAQKVMELVVETCDYEPYGVSVPFDDVIELSLSVCLD